MIYVDTPLIIHNALINYEITVPYICKVGRKTIPQEKSVIVQGYSYKDAFITWLATNNMENLRYLECNSTFLQEKYAAEHGYSLVNVQPAYAKNLEQFWDVPLGEDENYYVKFGSFVPEYIKDNIKYKYQMAVMEVPNSYDYAWEVELATSTIYHLRSYLYIFPDCYDFVLETKHAIGGGTEIWFYDYADHSIPPKLLQSFSNTDEVEHRVCLARYLNDGTLLPNIKEYIYYQIQDDDLVASFDLGFIHEGDFPNWEVLLK